MSSSRELRLILVVNVRKSRLHPTLPAIATKYSFRRSIMAPGPKTGVARSAYNVERSEQAQKIVQ